MGNVVRCRTDDFKFASDGEKERAGDRMDHRVIYKAKPLNMQSGTLPLISIQSPSTCQEVHHAVR